MLRGALLFGIALASLTGCGGGCPEVQRVDASAAEPALVSILFSVQCDGEPVTTLEAGDLTLFEGGSEVSTAEADWVLEPHSASLETYTLLLIDVSDSIIDSGTLEVAREVAAEFSGSLVSRSQKVSVAVFDGHETIRTIVEFTDDEQTLEDGIAGIGASDQLDASTNLNGAVLQGLDVLDEVVQPSVEAELVSVANLVVFTDGVDRAGRESDSTVRNSVNSSAHQVYVVGLVGEEDAEALEALAKDGFFRADDPADLFDSFDELAASLVAEVNKYYRLSYCSPLRKPRTKLRVEVLFEEKRDAISFSYATKDFGAGCEAGE